jgi:pimeloyl-ACP methyl ester carboxylesterase
VQWLIASVLVGVGLIGPSVAAASPSPTWSLNLPDPTSEWSNTLAWKTASAADGEVAASFWAASCGGSTTIVDSVGNPTSTISGLGSVLPTGEPNRWIRVVGSAFVESCSSGAVQLIDSTGHVIWSYELALNDLPDNVVLGGAGVIYVTYRQFFGNIEYMVGLDRSTGAVRFNKSLSELGMPSSLAFAGSRGISAYGEAFAGTPEGAVAVSGGIFTYINGSGEVLHTGSYPDGADPLAAVNAVGEVLATYLIPNKGITEEVEHEPAQGYGTLIASDGSVRWSHELILPGNYASKPVVAAAPNDVWVFIDENNDALDSVLPTATAIRGSDGTQLWATRLLPMEKNSGLSLVGVDTTRHLYVYGREQAPCSEHCEAECSYTCKYRHVVMTLGTDTGEDDGRIEVPWVVGFINGGGSSVGGGHLALVAEPAETGLEGSHAARLQTYALPGGGISYPPPPESPPEPGAGQNPKDGSSGAGGGSGSPGSGTTHGVPVVLVPGLNESASGVQSRKSCSPDGGPFIELCEKLAGARFDVAVVSASRGGHSAVLDNEGDLYRNAQALTKFLAQTFPGRPALLVGHSMGGLIARIAISRYHAPAAGLFTIGTPHDGSFAADAAVLFSNLACSRAPVCATLLAAMQAEFPVNSTAVWEMTWPARAFDRMPAPGVPTWTFAGTVFNPFYIKDSYLFPDDLIVGSSSAWGENANLPSTRLEGSLYHVPWMGPHGDNEFEAPAVLNAVVAAAQQISTSAHSAAIHSGRPTTTTSRAASGRIASSHARHRRKSRVRSSVVSIPLIGAARASRATSVVKLPINGFIVAGREFRLSCGDHTGPAPMLAPGVFGLVTSELECAGSMATIPSGVAFVTATAPQNILATARRSGSKTVLTIRSNGPLSSVIISAGKHRRRVHSAHGLFQASLKEQIGSRAMVTITVDRHVYRGVIP